VRSEAYGVRVFDYSKPRKTGDPDELGITKKAAKIGEFFDNILS
jgi:hypothetical protein